MTWNRGRGRDARRGRASRIAKPLARTDELIVEAVGDELLVYDSRAHQAHSLSSDAARVWRACDGESEVHAIAAALDMDAETVSRALDELCDCALMDESPASAGLTRRDLTLRAAKVGATAAAVPLIWSVAGPIPGAAATVTVEFCLQGQTSHGCGEDCFKKKCGCCCCQGVPDNLKPFECSADTKCCLPPTQCASVFHGFCSAGPQTTCP